jgi:hypothetical protein
MVRRKTQPDDPFMWPWTALPVLFRLRRELLTLPIENRSPEWWRKRDTKLRNLDDAIQRFMAFM